MSIKHPKDFKQEAVRIALTSGLPRRRVASDLWTSSHGNGVEGSGP